MTRIRLQTILLALTVVIWGCKSKAGSAINELIIRKSDDPKEWPFNVSQGVLRCDKNPKSPGLAAVTFTAGDVTYGLNGGALTGDAYLSADPITTRNAIGLFSGNYAKYLDNGLELCRKLDPADQPAYLPRKSGQ